MQISDIQGKNPLYPLLADRGLERMNLSDRAADIRVKAEQVGGVVFVFDL